LVSHPKGRIRIELPENQVPRRFSELRKKKKRLYRNYMTGDFMICSLHLILLEIYEKRDIKVCGK
jgi:hypothetical protein